MSNLPRLNILNCFSVICFLTVSFLCILGSYEDAIRFYGTDLYARTTGAQELHLGGSPYMNKGGTEKPAWLNDPHPGIQGYSRATYCPTLLLAYMPLCNVPYRSQRVAYVLLEWTAMISTIIVLSYGLISKERRWIFLLLASSFFIPSLFWRMHVERGQYYIFFVLLLSITIVGVVKKWPTLLTGLSCGMAIALRPNLLALCGMMFFLGKKKVSLAAASVAFLFFLISLKWGGLENWIDYKKLVSSYEAQMFVTHGHGKFTVPGKVEGYETAKMLSVPTTNTTATGAIGKLGSMLGLTFEQMTKTNSIVRILGLFCLVGVFWTFLWKHQKSFSQDGGILIAIILAFCGDYFLPIRYGYADVQWLIPIAIFVNFTSINKTGTAVALILLSGLIFMNLNSGFGLVLWLSRWLAQISMVVGGLLAVWFCMNQSEHPSIERIEI